MHKVQELTLTFMSSNNYNLGYMTEKGIHA